MQDGLAGHILPSDLVQEKLLSADLAEIGTISESRLTEISSEIADILENLDGRRQEFDRCCQRGWRFFRCHFELKKAVKSIGRILRLILTVLL